MMQQSLQSIASSLEPLNTQRINRKVNYCSGWLAALNYLALQDEQVGNGMAFLDSYSS
jgi:hypothetical protein